MATATNLDAARRLRLVESDLIRPLMADGRRMTWSFERRKCSQEPTVAVLSRRSDNDPLLQVFTAKIL